MKTWDLTTGAARLEEALDGLHLAWNQTTEHWDDESSRKFHEQYLAPLGPRAHRALEAIHRLAQVFAKAQRACGDE